MSQSLKFKITGVTPLLLHNGDLANPFYKYTKLIKEITSKKKKTDADLRALMKLEFLGGLHIKDGKPCVTAEMIEATLVKASKLSKRGKDAMRAIVVADGAVLEYKGEHDPIKMQDDDSYFFTTQARVGQGKVMRTRPIFRDWACEFTVQYNENVFNEKDIIDLVEIAGTDIGLGDWRPKYGQFTAEVIKTKAKAA